MAAEQKLTHKLLVERAMRWLRDSQRCPVVLSELRVGSEKPDALGFHYGGSVILVECKASRSDFLADRHKPSRRGGYMVGDERWYFVQRGIVHPSDDLDGWGLAEVRPWGEKTAVFKLVEPTTRPFDEKRAWKEKRFLVNLIRKIDWLHPEGIRGILDHPFPLDSGNNQVSFLGEKRQGE